jgi:hypothetical protein
LIPADHATSRPKPPSSPDDSVGKTAKQISDKLTCFARPDRNPDGSLNIKAAAQQLLRLRLLIRPLESSRALSGRMSEEEIRAALDSLEFLVKERNGQDPLKRLWRNLSDLVLGYRTDFELRAPRNAHYENTDSQFAKGSLVAIMQKRCEVACLSPDEAASWLARLIQRQPNFSRLIDHPNKFNGKTILGWRRKCRTKKSVYRAAYREWLTFLGGETLTAAQCEAFVAAIAEHMLASGEKTT